MKESLGGALHEELDKDSWRDAGGKPGAHGYPPKGDALWPPGLSSDEFMALRALENQRVLLTFRDGQSFIARLLSVTSDLDRSQHLIYDQVEGVSALEGIACYAAGEELLSCEGAE